MHAPPASRLPGSGLARLVRMHACIHAGVKVWPSGAGSSPGKGPTCMHACASTRWAVLQLVRKADAHACLRTLRRGLVSPYQPRDVWPQDPHEATKISIQPLLAGTASPGRSSWTPGPADAVLQNSFCLPCLSRRRHQPSPPRPAPNPHLLPHLPAQGPLGLGVGRSLYHFSCSFRTVASRDRRG